MPLAHAGIRRRGLINVACTQKSLFSSIKPMRPVSGGKVLNHMLVLRTVLVQAFAANGEPIFNIVELLSPSSIEAFVLGLLKRRGAKIM
jgi:hypothetical protein